MFLRVLRCFSSPRSLPPAYGFSGGWPGINRTGLPHSEILGLMRVCRYPRLIAAYHVLHRLPVPRHPPYTLCNLTENPWVARSIFSVEENRDVSSMKLSKNGSAAAPHRGTAKACARRHRAVESGKKWRRPGSNRRPTACKTVALPAELRPPIHPRRPTSAARRSVLRLSKSNWA